jgi:hypothetical protein
MTVETTPNEKFLQMLHGPGGGFFKKSPWPPEAKEMVDFGGISKE